MNRQTFIDIPVLKIIDYFSGQFNAYLDAALQIGKLLFIAGIIWCAIQMVFGTMDNRKFIVGIVTKWFLFLFIMSFYPAVSKGLLNFSVQLGTYVSGASISDIASELKSYMDSLESVVNVLFDDADEAVKNYQKLIAEAEKETAFTKSEIKKKNKKIKKLQEDLYSAEQEKQRLEEQKEYAEEHSEGIYKTINAIKTVLVIDGTSTKEAYTLDLQMRDAEGEKTDYLSPNAMLRLSIFAGDIMWQKFWEEDTLANWKESAEEDKLIKTPSFMSFPFAKIFDLILCFFARIVIVCITIFENIQYVMCLIEFTICISFGIILVPCLLFDGLKDMAAKLLPSLLAQSVKLAMITICMYFCCYTYLDMAKAIISDRAEFGIWSFTYVLFTCFLTFALCTNAPKLASAMLTGQPQMSMGEFVQAAGAIAGGTAMGVNMARGAVGASSRFAANRMGDAAAMAGGAMAGQINAVRDGKGKFGQAMGAIGGAAKVAGQRTGNRISGAAQNAANYKGGNPLSKFGFGSSGSGGGSGMGGSSGGTNRFGSNNPQQEAAWKKEPEEQGKNQHSMAYGDHVTANGTKSTFNEYMQDQVRGGYESVKYRQYGEHKPDKPHPDAPGKNNFNPPAMFNGGGGGSIVPIRPNGGMPVANGNYSSSYTPKQSDEGNTMYLRPDDYTVIDE